MLIGVPKEIKNNEYRVGMTPAGVLELVRNGHQLIVETNAGSAIGFNDNEYIKAGAEIATDAATIFARCDMIVKVESVMNFV